MRISIQFCDDMLGLGHVAVEHDVELMFRKRPIIATASLADFIQHGLF